jgi:prepilin-type N-terminal cleavage/methylation domain-containing protein/prepilin-type processing-associated H-X9-DG protein
MNRVRAAGFTLIELLIVVGIIGLLAAAFLPDLLAGKETANIEADKANMRQFAQWLEMSKSRNRGLPTEGGHGFLLTLWTKELIDHSPANFDRFFTPGIREEDNQWKALRPQVERNEKIWTSLADTTTEDTNYAARAKEHLKGMTAYTEAWMANDNEGVWAFKSGVVNILWGDGSVRDLQWNDMKDRFNLVDKTEPFKTWGPDSPYDALQKLAN